MTENPYGLPDDVWRNIQPIEPTEPAPTSAVTQSSGGACQAPCCNPVIYVPYDTPWTDSARANYVPGVADIPIAEWESMSTQQKFAYLG